MNLAVRVGCNLAYETTVPTVVLFVLRPRLEGWVMVMQERLSFGIGLPSCEFQDSHGNITYRSTFTTGQLTVFAQDGHPGNLFNPAEQKSILAALTPMRPPEPGSK